MIIGFLVIAGVIIYMLQDRTTTNDSKSNFALDRLNERFINGEIDDVTYMKMKAILTKK